MLYRYLHTHGYETLRDHEFLVSPPGKFNDALDCAAKDAIKCAVSCANVYLSHEI